MRTDAVERLLGLANCAATGSVPICQAYLDCIEAIGVDRVCEAVWRALPEAFKTYGSWLTPADVTQELYIDMKISGKLDLGLIDDDFIYQMIYVTAIPADVCVLASIAYILYTVQSSHQWVGSDIAMHFVDKTVECRTGLSVSAKNAIGTFALQSLALGLECLADDALAALAFAAATLLHPRDVRVDEYMMNVLLTFIKLYADENEGEAMASASQALQKLRLLSG